MLDFHLVHEALTERDLLLKKLAPHLVRPGVLPLPARARGTGSAPTSAPASRCTTPSPRSPPGKRAMPWHRHVTRKPAWSACSPTCGTTPRSAPCATTTRASTTPASSSTLIRTAVSYGATGREPHPGRRADQARHRRGERRASSWTWRAGASSPSTPTRSSTRPASGPRRPRRSPDTDGGLHVLASKGIHIVVPRDRIRGHVGLILQTEKCVLFVIPWSRYWVIGTTDTPWKQELQHPVADRRRTSTTCSSTPTRCSPSRSPGTTSSAPGPGLRPLLQPGTKEGTSSAKVSREHTVASPTPGLTVIAGGKLTTYRVMAKDAVDFALGERAAGPALDHRPDPARGRRGARGAPAPGPPRSPRSTAGPGARRPPAAPLRLDARRPGRVRRRRTRPGPAARAAHPRTCGPRSPTPRRTRACCTSRT